MKFSSEKDALEISLYVAGIFALVSVGFAGIKMGDLANSAQQDMTRVTQQVNRLVIIAAGTATNVEKSTRSIQAKEDAEYAQIQAMSLQLNSIAKNANVGVLELNDTLASVNTLVKDSDTQIVKVTNHADETIQAATPAVKALTVDLVKFGTTLDTANKVMGDPNIPQGIANFNAAMKNFMVMTADGVIVMNDAAKSADWAYKRLTAPVTTARAIGNFAWHSALTFGGAYVGASH